MIDRFVRCLKTFAPATSIALGCFMAVAPAFTQNYPVRPVRIIVPTSPPGGADVVARLIAPGLSERLGQQVIVDNRAGRAP